MWINVLIFLAVGAVGLTLFAGMFNLARGGENEGKRSNIIMRWRVVLQAVAIVMLMIGFYLKSRTGT
jgi:hypothetical protein